MLLWHPWEREGNLPRGELFARPRAVVSFLCASRRAQQASAPATEKSKAKTRSYTGPVVNPEPYISRATVLAQLKNSIS